jgi:hypothetical protein
MNSKILCIPSIEPRIKVVFFAAVAGATEGLQVADIVAAAAGQGDDVIDRQLLGLATALTLVVISLKNIFPNFFRKADALRFLWHDGYLAHIPLLFAKKNN